MNIDIQNIDGLEYLKTVEYGEYYEEKKGVWILKE